jgi:SnoaL-like domain
VEQSPLADLLSAIDKLDVDAVLALCAPDCSLMTADGRHAEGKHEVSRLMGDFLSTLRSTSHQITVQWHQEDEWIAEVLASYELQDWLRLEHLRRAFFVRTGPAGIRDIRVYGANEPRLADHLSEQQPMRVGGRLVLPL